MFLSILSDLQLWISQLQNILFSKMHNVSPQDYCIMLVFVVCIGYCLLKGRSI